MSDKMSYSNEEYWEMVRAYALANNSVRGAIKLYAEMFPKRRVPCYYVMHNVNQRLREFGRFTVPAHAQARGRERHSIRVEEGILKHFEKDPQASTRKAARRFGVSQWAAWNVVRKKGQEEAEEEPGMNDLEPPESPKSAKNKTIDLQKNIRRVTKNLQPTSDQPSTSRDSISVTSDDSDDSDEPLRKKKPKTTAKQSKTSEQYLKTIKALQQKCKSLKRKIASQEKIISELKSKNIIDIETTNLAK